MRGALTALSEGSPATQPDPTSPAVLPKRSELPVVAETAGLDNRDNQLSVAEYVGASWTRTSDLSIIRAARSLAGGRWRLLAQVSRGERPEANPPEWRRPRDGSAMAVQCVVLRGGRSRGTRQSLSTG